MTQPKAGQFAKATAAKLETLADEVLASYQQDLRKGKVSANAKPLHAGIFLTKRQECLEESADKPQPEQDGASIGSALEALAALGLVPPQPVQVNVLVGSQGVAGASGAGPGQP